MAAMRAASQKIRHVHLELGGKAPVIVFEDADLDAVAETIRYGSYFNAGQDCAQPCRVIAQKGIYDDLVARIEAQVKEIQIGAQKAEGTEMGPIVSDEQRARIAALVDRARDTCDVVKGDARVMVRDISTNPPYSRTWTMWPRSPHPRCLALWYPFPRFRRQRMHYALQMHRITGSPHPFGRRTLSAPCR
jgi:hypothetical protein